MLGAQEEKKAGKGRSLLIFISCLLLGTMVYRATQGTLSLTHASATEGTASADGTPKVGIVVLGGGVTSDGLVYPHTELRILKAVEIYRQLTTPSAGTGTDVVPVVTMMPLSGGTPHKPPPRDSDGFPIAEATAAARVMIEKYDIPPDSIREESWSIDTLGNSYFLRQLLVVPGRYDKLIIITNNWHMHRTKAMFEYVFSLPDSISTTTTTTTGGDGMNSHPRPQVELNFVSVEAGLPADTLAAREKREAASLASFNNQVKAQFNDVESFSKFIFTKHGSYSSSRLLQKRAPLDSAVMATY